jgi:DNA-directed RNA polymerase subunit RPC12/RpoP
MDQIHFSPDEQAEINKFCAERGNDVKVVNADGLTLLDLAAQMGKIEIVRFLVSKGADVKAKSNGGYTSLNWAAAGGGVEVVNFLISSGADFNTKTDEGFTPLHNAAILGKVEVAKVLVSAGADVNEKDSNGRTPLDLAKTIAIARGDTAMTAMIQYLSGISTTSANLATGNSLPVRTFALFYREDILGEQLRQWCQKVPYSHFFYPKVSGFLNRERYNCGMLTCFAIIVTVTGLMAGGLVFVHDLAYESVGTFTVFAMFIGTVIAIPGIICVVLIDGYNLRCPSCGQHRVVKWSERSALVSPVLQGSQKKNSIIVRCKHCGYEWVYEYEK